MHTITVDDEQIAVNSLLRLLRQIDPDGHHEGVIRAEQFMNYIAENNVDIAFIDVDLYGADGITLTKILSKNYPELNVILYTGHPEFKAEALDLYVSGYLVKPVLRADLEQALSHLRYPIRNVRVQCFGFFEVFVNEKPLKFARKDSKEVFAYLIDRRGAEVSDEMLRCLLWSEDEDTDKKKAYIRNIIYDIRNTFSSVGIEDIIFSRHGYYSVDIQKIKCDYYDFLNGKPVASLPLHEYMEQFSSWSVQTKEALFRHPSK